MMAQVPQSQPLNVVYTPVLTQLRRCFIAKMAKPEEVLPICLTLLTTQVFLTENENGEVVREIIRDTEVSVENNILLIL